jgi:hypothetical protein
MLEGRPVERRIVEALERGGKRDRLQLQAILKGAKVNGQKGRARLKTDVPETEAVEEGAVPETLDTRWKTNRLQ